MESLKAIHFYIPGDSVLINSPESVFHGMAGVVVGYSTPDWLPIPMDPIPEFVVVYVSQVQLNLQFNEQELERRHAK